MTIGTVMAIVLKISWSVHQQRYIQPNRLDLNIAKSHYLSLFRRDVLLYGHNQMVCCGALSEKARVLIRNARERRAWQEDPTQGGVAFDNQGASLTCYFRD